MENQLDQTGVVYLTVIHTVRSEQEKSTAHVPVSLYHKSGINLQ